MRIDSASDGLEVVISRRNALALMHKTAWGAAPPRLERTEAGTGLNLALDVRRGPQGAPVRAEVEPDGWLALTLAPGVLERAVEGLDGRMGPLVAGETTLAGTTAVRLVVERDERHYAGRGLPPGPMHPATERFIAAAA